MSICTKYCDKCHYRKTLVGGQKFGLWCCDYFMMTGKRRPSPAGDGCTVRVVQDIFRRKERTEEERAAFAELQKQKRRERDKIRYLNATPEQRERQREKCRKYYHNHRAEQDAKHREYYQANRERINEYNRERRRKKKGAAE